MAKGLGYAIEELVPHRPPMILIDRLLEATETRAVALVRVDEGSLFLGSEGVPAYVGIEYMAQTIAAHGGYLSRQKGEPVKTGFLLGTPKMTCAEPFFEMGATLRIEVEKEWGDDQLMRFLCAIFDHNSGERLQYAALNVLQPNDLQEFLDQKHHGGKGGKGAESMGAKP